VRKSTETKIELQNFRLVNDDITKAVSSIVINGDFAIHGVRIVEFKPNELMVSMPSRMYAPGNYSDIANPVNKVARDKLESILFNEYHNQLEMNREK